LAPATQHVCLLFNKQTGCVRFTESACKIAHLEPYQKPSASALGPTCKACEYRDGHYPWINQSQTYEHVKLTEDPGQVSPGGTSFFSYHSVVSCESMSKHMQVHMHSACMLSFPKASADA